MDLLIRNRALDVNPALSRGAVGEQRIARHEYYLRIRTVFDTRQVEASRLGIHPEVLKANSEGAVPPSATFLHPLGLDGFAPGRPSGPERHPPAIAK